MMQDVAAASEQVREKRPVGVDLDALMAPTFAHLIVLRLLTAQVPVHLLFLTPLLPLPTFKQKFLTD